MHSDTLQRHKIATYKDYVIGCQHEFYHKDEIILIVFPSNKKCTKILQYFRKNDREVIRIQMAMYPPCTTAICTELIDLIDDVLPSSSIRNV